VIPRSERKLGADTGVAKVTPSWDRGRLARIGSARRTRQPVSARCPGFGALFGTTHWQPWVGWIILLIRCWFGQGMIGRRKFSNDKNPVNPV